MVPEVVAFAQVSAIIVSLVGSLATIGVITTRAVQRARRLGPPPAPSEGQQAQMAQLQQSVDAVAVEVERIAEAQRFTARLVAEQAGLSPAQR